MRHPTTRGWWLDRGHQIPELTGLVLMVAGFTLSLAWAIEGHGYGALATSLVVVGAVIWHWFNTRYAIERVSRPVADAYNEGFDHGHEKGWFECRDRDSLQVVELRRRQES